MFPMAPVQRHYLALGVLLVDGPARLQREHFFSVDRDDLHTRVVLLPSFEFFLLELAVVDLYSSRMPGSFTFPAVLVGR